MDEAVASVPDFDSDNRRTGYRQIAQTIKNWILSGRLNVGDKIPTENQLSTHFSVARLTVRRALKVLVDDGILTQKRPIGTFVTEQPVAGPIIAPLEAWTKQVAEPDKGTFWTLISRREVTPLFHIRDALQVEDGIGVLEFTVLREQDGIPNALTTAYLAPWARELTEEADFQDGRTLFNALSDAGIKPFRVHQSMGAQLADPELAGHLDIDINTPVLTILRTNADKQGRTITFDQVFVRTDRFRYQVDFIRDVG